MAEKAHMMQPQGALALVGGGEERLGFYRRDQCQGTVHARPGRWARGGGQRHRGLERGHRRKPFLLQSTGTASARHAGGGQRSSRPPGFVPARVWVEPLGLVAWTGQPWLCPKGTLGWRPRGSILRP